MSKFVFRMRLPSPNLVVEIDEASGGVNIHALSTQFGARELDQQIGGTGRVVELSELVTRAFRKAGKPTK